MWLKMIQKISNRVGAIYDFFFEKVFFDKPSVISDETKKFKEFSITRDEATIVLNKVLRKILKREYDENIDSSHWLICAAISKSVKINRILEIGTYTGEFTAILSALFPKSEIITVDLPKSDPILRNSYQRHNNELYMNFKNKQKKNINYSNNINLILCNSFFLKDKVSGTFDLIWVDGGHNYPEIAWDLCISYSILNEGGILMCDDIIKLERDYIKGLVSTDSYRVIDYLDQRIQSELIYFLKRLSGKRYARLQNRKYIAYLKK